MWLDLAIWLKTTFFIHMTGSSCCLKWEGCWYWTCVFSKEDSESQNKSKLGIWLSQYIKASFWFAFILWLLNLLQKEQWDLIEQRLKDRENGEIPRTRPIQRVIKHRRRTSVLIGYQSRLVVNLNLLKIVYIEK